MSTEAVPVRRVSPWWLLPPSLVFAANFVAVAVSGSTGERNGV